MMEKKTAYCLFFLVLLVPYTALGAVLKRAPAKKEKRAVPLAVPLVYWGASVSPAVWNWLLVTFGAAAVAAAAVTVSDSNSHNCGGFWNQGWCRTTCHDNEYVDDYHSDVCDEDAGYKCCRPQ